MFLVVTKARLHGVIALDGVKREPSQDVSGEIFVILCKLSGSEPNVVYNKLLGLLLCSAK